MEGTPQKPKEQLTKPKEENPFQQADDIVSFLEKHQYFDKLRATLKDDLNEWGSVLFKAARSAEGHQIAVYAINLQRLERYVDPKKYDDMLQIIQTNRLAISELIDKNIDYYQGLAQGLGLKRLAGFL